MDALTPEAARAAAPVPAFTHRQIATIMTGLMLSLFLTTIDQSIFAPALPRIARDLSGEASISWIISIYLLSSTAVTPIYGKLSDLYGRKIILQIAMSIFIVGSVLCALATDMTQLIGFRLLQGIGGGALMPMAFAVAGDVVPARERGRYQGYFSAAFGAASVIGPMLGGWFADQLSWRFAFWINIPLGIAAMIIAEFTLRGLKPKRLRHRIDYAGALLIIGAASSIMVVITLGGHELAWSAPPLLGLAALGLLLLAVAIVQERRASDPILPPRLFRNPTFVVANLTTMICSLGIIGSTIFIPNFFQVVYGMTAKASGAAIMPFLLLWTIFSLATGRYVAATGRYRWLPPVGLVPAAAALLGLASVTAATPLWLAIAYVGLLGIGAAPAFNVMLVGMQNAVERTDLGAATSTNGFVRSLGSAFGVTIFGAMLAGGGGTSAEGGAFRLMFLAAAAITFLALVISLFLKELPLAQRH
jgi:EmrB/QacA subfamily drug resistance transporter